MSAEHSALVILKINCSGLGLDCRLAYKAQTASNAWTALHHPFTNRPTFAWAKVRSSVSVQLT